MDSASEGPHLLNLLASQLSANILSLVSPEDYQCLRTLADKGRAGDIIFSPRDIALIKQAIPKLESELTALKRKTLYPVSLIGYSRLLAHLQDVITPIHQLPDDILLRIFFEASPVNYDLLNPSSSLLGTNSFDVKKYIPWSLRAVCLRWKILILNTKIFWNRMAVVPQHPPRSSNRIFTTQLAADAVANGQEQALPNHNPPPAAHQRREPEYEEYDDSKWPPPGIISESVKRLIQRAQSLLPSVGPLSIGICQSAHGVIEVKTTITQGSYSLLSTPEGVQYLTDIGPRIRVLQVDRTLTARERLIKLPTTTFPNLESLCMPTVKGQSEAVALFINSINLQCLNLAFTSPSDFTSFMSQSISWSQLIELTLNVNQISQTDSFRQFQSTFTVQGIAMERLQELDVDTWTSSILPFLTLPALRSLKIGHSYFEDSISTVAQAVTGLIRRSDCKLDQFTERPENERGQLNPLSPHRSGTSVDQFQSNFEKLALTISSVRIVTLNGIKLNLKEIQRIGFGELFPNAEVLDFPCQTTYQEALDALIPRFPKLKTGPGALLYVRPRARIGVIGRSDAKLVRERYWRDFRAHVEVFYE